MCRQPKNDTQAFNLSETAVTDIVKRHATDQPILIFNPHASNMAPKKQPQTPSVYQLKITLKGCRPPIWRRVQVLSDSTLAQLHWVIQFSVGWTNSHLHSFTIQGVDYGMPMPEFDFGDPEMRDEQTAILSKIIPREKFKFFISMTSVILGSMRSWWKRFWKLILK